MKIRYGFVSNSSSTSFIVSIADHTAKSLAIVMMKIRNEDWADEEETSRLVTEHTETQNPKLLKVIENNINSLISDEQELNNLIHSKLDPNTPIVFATTNYDTYIMRFNDFLLVSTCNNHDWNAIPQWQSIDKIFPKEVKDEFRKLFGDCSEIRESIEFDLQYVTSFWWPRHNTYVQCTRGGDDNGCQIKDHCCDKINTSADGKNFELICPMCKFGDRIG